MNVIGNDETSEDVCTGRHKVRNRPLLTEFNWKLKMNDSSNTNVCWRDCKQVGGHTHI